VCAIGGHVIADEHDVDVNHAEPVSDGGDPYDPANLRIACRRCNRRRKRTPGPRPGRRTDLPRWMPDR
jgi:5-methylcytosine-specific restriction endonuclease McrA